MMLKLPHLWGENQDGIVYKKNGEKSINITLVPSQSNQGSDILMAIFMAKSRNEKAEYQLVNHLKYDSHICF